MKKQGNEQKSDGDTLRTFFETIFFGVERRRLLEGLSLPFLTYAVQKSKTG